LELSFYTAILIGLLGSTHCAGMCGGIVAALNMGVKRPAPQTSLMRITHHFNYNTGRVLSYTVAGAIAGLLGSQAERFSPAVTLPLGSLIAGLFMIALGLYLADWWKAISGIEKLGLYLWRYLEPMGRQFIPARHPLQVFGLGLVWGWLPCGLVYMALALAIVSASPLRGALLMLGFGIGTLPMLMAMGSLAAYLQTLAQHSLVRRFTGALIISFGFYTCVSALFENRHEHRGIAETEIHHTTMPVARK